MKRKHSYFLIILALLFLRCGNQQNIKNQDDDLNYAKTREFADLWFHHSAEMEACYYQTYKMAELMLDNHLAKLSKESKKPAVVLDIDETVLDNSPYQLKLIEQNVEYTDENWAEWVLLAKAKALPGSLEFINYAKSKGVEIFYISNRNVKQLEVTIKNLDSLGFPFADSTHILLKEKTSNKTGRRDKVAENHNIILFVGDNLTDFSQDFAKRSTSTMGKDMVEKNKALFGDKYIMLPNPMYGEWEKAIYNDSYKWTEKQKDSLRALVIESGY